VAAGRPKRDARPATTDSEAINAERGVFMISVAAELAGMHPQTLRMYEARGLIAPKRSPKNTRLYSQADVERLRRIQRMTNEEGLNLAGVETVLRMEVTMARLKAEMARMRRRAAESERRLTAELERLRKTRGGELVLYSAHDTRLSKPTRPTGASVRKPRRGKP
jgi:MerR family transcriptional regulator/heat shock protein HspR